MYFSTRNFYVLRKQILVTHHVELVPPKAGYLVRMLDGTIDTKGVVKELRAQGVLDDITQDSITLEKQPPPSEQMSDLEDFAKPIGDTAKKPRAFVKDEQRVIGEVKCSIYSTYLKASYVITTFLGSPMN